MLGRAHVSKNPQASCAIVAQSLLRELHRSDTREMAEERREVAKVLAQTLLRVLDGYKFGVLRREHAHHGVLHRGSVSPEIRLSDGQAERVQEALTQAQKAVFPSKDTEETVGILSRTIKSEFGLSDPSHTGNRADLEQFLRRLLSELEPAA